jgi:precorrin-6A synthase
VRKIFVIGIGAGDPDHLTVQAIKALNRVDVFVILGKGAEKQELVDLRLRIIAEHVADRPYRLVEVPDPERDRTASAYASAVHDWRRRRADVCEQVIRRELGPDECGAFLVWGDPALYDSTLAIVEDILSRGTVEFEYEVIPGISSVSTLAARHRIGLNRVGRPVQITTGRRLSEALAGPGLPDGSGLPDGVDDVVVMLDAHCAFAQITDQDTDIYWGAYLGTPDELLISGPVPEVANQIQTIRAEAQHRKGWIMDTYLLRRTPPP